MGGVRRQGFALIELAAAAVAIAVVVALLQILARGTRHQGWQAGSVANLHQFAAITASYQADYADQFWSYSWTSGVVPNTSYPDLRFPGSAQVMALEQSIDIVRRHGYPNMEPGAGYAPTVLLHHLPLADYLNVPSIMRFAISPGDRYRAMWTNDPARFLVQGFGRDQPELWNGERLLFSSSYRASQAFFTPDAVTAQHGTLAGIDDWDHYQYAGPDFNHGRRRLNEVVYPSLKVHVFDSAQWQGVRRPVFFAYGFARIPMLMVDGSAHVRTSSQSNLGFRPDTPRAPFATYLPYIDHPDDPWLPPALPGTGQAQYGYYYWTRGGLHGRDFDGQEVSTANW